MHALDTTSAEAVAAARDLVWFSQHEQADGAVSLLVYSMVDQRTHRRIRRREALRRVWQVGEVTLQLVAVAVLFGRCYRYRLLVGSDFQRVGLSRVRWSPVIIGPPGPSIAEIYGLPSSYSVPPL